ncbi:MAG: ATP-binding protein [FCB group bacterium]|jgi:MinD superfamily P-loop ATPase|nr:ATP-binding protein [FCB group bacterium]
MKELVVISGKGGTGKTSIVASFAALAGRAVLADCDVDAADLHLVLAPEVRRRESFSGGQRARIVAERCTLCGRCKMLCRFDAISLVETGDGGSAYFIDPYACEGCGVCAHECMKRAIEFGPVETGEWFVSETRHGPMVHAQLGIAAENSGKLVTVVRNEARKIAQNRGRSLLIVDGPPGIGCPVIASITGSTHVLAVTEPTVSGEHDVERVLELAAHFHVPVSVCVNKWDINPEMTERIEQRAREKGAEPIGRIRYDSAVTAAQMKGVSAVEYDDSPAAQDVRKGWERLCDRIS